MRLGEQADGERRVRIAQREEPVQRPVLARVRGDIGEIKARYRPVQRPVLARVRARAREG